MLASYVISQGKPIQPTYGNLLQRVIYHTWYHTGENMAMRQLLGHAWLPVYVGDIDGMTALFAADAVMLDSIGGEPIVGHEAIHNLLASRHRPSRTVEVVVHVEPATD